MCEFKCMLLERKWQRRNVLLKCFVFTLRGTSSIWCSASWKQECRRPLWWKLCHYTSLFLSASRLPRGEQKWGKRETSVTIRTLSQVFLTAGSRCKASAEQRQEAEHWDGMTTMAKGYWLYIGKTNHQRLLCSADPSLCWVWHTAD